MHWWLTLSGLIEPIVVDYPLSYNHDAQYGSHYLGYNGCRFTQPGKSNYWRTPVTEHYAHKIGADGCAPDAIRV